MRHPVKILLAFALTLVIAGPAAAQTPGTFAAGISFLRDGDADETGVGITVDYSSDFQTRDEYGIGWVGDFGLHSFEFSRSATFMAGIRITGRGNPDLTWFGQFLIGAANISATGDTGDLCDELEIDCGNTDLAFAPGVGVTIPINARVSFRGQIDFMFISTEGDTVSAQRFWFGLALPVGQ